MAYVENGKSLNVAVEEGIDEDGGEGGGSEGGGEKWKWLEKRNEWRSGRGGDKRRKGK